MAQPELYKDKIEVSLDGRQIFYLFFGGAVIVGLVFVLGVMVGRRVEARGHAGRAHAEAALDPLAALDRLEGGGGLSFAGTLRGAEAAAVAEPPVDKQIEEIAKDKQATKPVEKGSKGSESVAKGSTTVSKGSESVSKGSTTVSQGSTTVSQGSTTVSQGSTTVSQGSTTVSQGSTTVVQHQETVAQRSSKEDQHSSKEDQHSSKEDQHSSKQDKPSSKDDKQASKEDKQPAKPDKDKSAKYALQLSSFQAKGDAEALVQSIKAAGFSAYVTEGDVDGKQYFRVRIGSYRSLEAANDAKADFEKKAKQSALVTKI